MVDRPRAMVLQEEQQPKCRSGGGEGSRPKKPNPNKVPQRGLGIAQLEKIRLEEQQKNAAAASSSISPFPGLIQQTSLPLLLPTDPNASIRPSIPVLWNPMEPCSHEAEALSRKFGFPASIMNDASNLDWRSSSLLQRRQHGQQQTSLVDNTLSPSPSGASLQVEAPSNQIYNSNCTMPSSWAEETRVDGLKRQCPFRLDVTLNHPSFPRNVPQFPSSILKPEELSPVYGNDSSKSESRNTSTALREGASSSSSYQIDWKSSDLHLDKSTKENASASDGCFLTLGPSVTPSISKCKQSMVSIDDAMSQDGGTGHLSFYSILPMGPKSSEVALRDQRGEALDCLDLNLNL